MLDERRIRARLRAGCLTNVGLKVVALIIAIIVSALVHRGAGPPADEPTRQAP